MNNLILIRHGHVEPKFENGVHVTYGPDGQLSELGHRQARQMARSLRAEGIVPDMLMVSPFKRAQQTAEPITSEFDLTPITVNDIQDVYCPGWWGVPNEDLRKVKGNIYSAAPRSEDQETFEDVFERAKNVLNFVLEGRDNQIIALVSHGDIIGAMNWILTREGLPVDYDELVTHKYLDRGQAIIHKLNDMRAEDEGRLIITKESLESAEGYRGNPEKK